jgi:hypothetical protein
LECFPKFTLNFIEGAGQGDGEILETLWSGMDEVAGLAQAMSIAHHQEVLDEYMNDSNWRKLIRTGRTHYYLFLLVELTLCLADSLCVKWDRAKEGVSETKPAFEELTDCLDASLIDSWTEQERAALDERGDSLNIYVTASTKCRKVFESAVDIGHLCIPVPSLADIRLKLSETEVQQGNLSGSVSALTEGLIIEKSQYVGNHFTTRIMSAATHYRMLLQRHVASLGSRCSVAQKNDLLDRRRKLEARITAYEHRISVIMKLDDDTLWSTQDGKIPDMDPQPGEVSDDYLELYPDGWFTPETERITLPSALAPGEITRLSLKSIAIIEAELRKGQVTDALEGLRLALGEKSLCFRTEVRNAHSQRTTHRAWDKVHKYDAEARKCRSTYRQAWRALQRLPAEPEYLETLHDITDIDLKVAGDLTDENRFGQRLDTLPWFWRIGDVVVSEGPRMQECM